MSRGAIIVRNVVSNWAGFLINAAVTLVLTPFVLRQLGPGRYGVWILTSSIIGYYGLLDVGFRAGVTQYLTRYLAVDDYLRASECMSSAVAVLAGLGSAIVGLSFAGGYLAPHLFHLPGGMANEAFWCILIIGCSSGVQFALNPFSSIFTARQRFDLANLIGVSTRLLTAAGIVLSLKMGRGLVGVSAAAATATVIDYVVRWRVAQRLVPQLKVSIRHASVERIREIGAFGGWNSLISINGFVYQHGPNIMIGWLMPIAAVGQYALATGLSRQINSILSPVPQAFYPTATELHAQGNRSGLERLYHDGSRLMLLITISVVLLATVWAPDFYRLWIGEKYLTGAPFHSVALLFQILMISMVTDYSSNVASLMLTGAGRVQTVAAALVCGSVLNVTLSVILIPRYGLAGIAVATVIASAIIDLIAMPLLLQRIMGLSVVGFLRHSCVRPLRVAIVQAMFLAVIRLAGRPEHWFAFFVQGSVAALGSAAIVAFIGITRIERERFLHEPIRRVLRLWKSREQIASPAGVHVR
jgi:O-antigen/teichoic acid export membrane protein